MRGRQRCATVLVGQSSLLREGAARLLLAANFRVVAATSCAHKLTASKAELGQRLFLIIYAGDQFDTTLSQVQLLRSRHPYERIAIVADCYRPDEILAAFRAGANGYFTGVMNSDVFIKSIELVMMGETVFPPDFRSLLFASDPRHRNDCHPSEDPSQIRMLPEARGSLLSPRETSILRCLVAGDSNKSIARKIDIAEATVKVHVKAILRKIRVQNRTQAAIWAVNQGWLDAPTVTSPHLCLAAEEEEIATDHQSGKVADTGATAPTNTLEPRATQPADRDLTRREINGTSVRLRELRR